MTKIFLGWAVGGAHPSSLLSVSLPWMVVRSAEKEGPFRGRYIRVDRIDTSLTVSTFTVACGCFRGRRLAIGGCLKVRGSSFLGDASKVLWTCEGCISVLP